MGKTILVVEDELKDLFENIFKLSCDYDVKTAENGLEAIRMAEMYRPALILMDMRLPKLDGIKAINRIRNSDWGATVPIIAISAYPDQYEEKAKFVGANLFISKPFDVEKLLVSVAELLSGGENGDMGTG
jgi:CheY-like chemotaxis protein